MRCWAWIKGQRCELGYNRRCGWNCCEWEMGFVKYDVLGNINSPRWLMKAEVSMMIWAVADEDAKLGARFKFIGGIGTKIGPTS